MRPHLTHESPYEDDCVCICLAKRMKSPFMMAFCKPWQTPCRASRILMPLDKKTGIAAMTSTRRTLPRPEASLYVSVSKPNDYSECPREVHQRQDQLTTTYHPSCTLERREGTLNHTGRDP